MPQDVSEDVFELSEQNEVILRRYTEAREYGIEAVSARLYAESDTDTGLLRKLIRLECPPDLAARILVGSLDMPP